MSFRDPDLGELDRFNLQLEEMVWRFAVSLTETDPAQVPFPADYTELSPAERRTLYLAHLRALTLADNMISEQAKTAAYGAGQEGANYRQIGDAWGISRQGARKRWPAATAEPEVGDRVRLTYGDGSSCEGTWEVTDEAAVLRLDDGTVHPHVTGQVRREIIDRAHMVDIITPGNKPL